MMSLPWQYYAKYGGTGPFYPIHAPTTTLKHRVFVAFWPQTRSFQALVSVVEDSRLAQSQQSELVRREKEATQAVKKLEADLFAERADHARQVALVPPQALCT